ncbi:MAG TPA: hypothetical protein VF702_10635 [Allosphingosinicella sp.]|jgi:hypothetical protein
MPYYRLYFIDAEGSIDSVEEFSARDDVEAVRISRDSVAFQPAQLWCRARIVESIGFPVPLPKGGHC